MANHEILSGKVQLYRRTNKTWHCSASIDGVQHRSSTKEEDLALARIAAEDWYLNLRGLSRVGLIKKKEITFAKVADQFELEYETITEGQRSPRWVDGHKHRLRLHLKPFFGSLGISEVTAGKVQAYRVHRAGQTGRKPRPTREGEEEQAAKPPSRSTIHDEIVTLRQVLKTAQRHAWLTHLPDLSPPYGTRGKISHRPWFSPVEYKALYTIRWKRSNVLRRVEASPATSSCLNTGIGDMERAGATQVTIPPCAMTTLGGKAIMGVIRLHENRSDTTHRAGLHAILIERSVWGRPDRRRTPTRMSGPPV